MHNPQFYVSGKKPMVTGHTQSYHMVVIRPVAVIPTGTSLIPYICHNRSQNIIFRENDIDCLAQLGVHAQFLLSRELFTTVPVGEAAMRAFLQNVITLGQPVEIKFVLTEMIMYRSTQSNLLFDTQGFF